MYAGQAEASLVHQDGFALRLHDIAIDESTLEVGILGIVLCQRTKVHNDHTDRESYLRSSEAYTIGTLIGLKHILYQFFQLGIIGIYILGYFS